MRNRPHRAVLPLVGIGRPHFGALLVERGLAADVNDVFNRYLGRGRPGYIKIRRR